MINVTVVKKRDVIKYLVRITVAIILIFVLARFFYRFKDTKDAIEIKEDSNDILISCLEETILQAKSTKQEKLEIKEEKEPVKTVLTKELEIMSAITKKDVTVQKLANEESSISMDETENIEIETDQPDILEKKEEVETNLKTEVVKNSVPNKYTNTYNGVQIKNETNLKITFRTTDLNFTVSRVGDELTNQLKYYGYNVIHDKTYHDYPSYNGSYARSLVTVQNLLKINPNTDVVFDIHRDAIGDSSYAPKVKIGDEYACQLMFVIGTNASGLEHAGWLQNLKFATMIQSKANELYPGLFKPIVVRSSRYNQHLSKCASIIEVGATGNTLEEANVSMKYLAKIISEVME